jgi:hypothetical protein
LPSCPWVERIGAPFLCRDRATHGRPFGRHRDAWRMIVVGVLAAPFFLSASPSWQVAGALLFLLHWILDGCAGELARLKFLAPGRDLLRLPITAAGLTTKVGAPKHVSSPATGLECHGAPQSRTRRSGPARAPRGRRRGPRSFQPSEQAPDRRGTTASRGGRLARRVRRPRLAALVADRRRARFGMTHRRAPSRPTPSAPGGVTPAGRQLKSERESSVNP